MTAPVVSSEAPCADPATAGARILVAGIGNVFLGDDGFGVEVVHRIDRAALPPGVDAVDYGIRGLHLAYELLDGAYGTVVLIDAVPVAGPPGTLAVLDIEDLGAGGDSSGGDSGGGAGAWGGGASVAVDGHGMDPRSVLRLLGALGGGVERVLVIGCRPAVVDERMGLSDAVLAVIDDAVRLVGEVVRSEVVRSGVARSGVARSGVARSELARSELARSEGNRSTDVAGVRTAGSENGPRPERRGRDDGQRHDQGRDDHG